MNALRIACEFCEKPIVSKLDLVVGSRPLSAPIPYHLECFGRAREEADFWRKPRMRIAPKRIPLFLAVNVLNVLVGAAFLVIGFGGFAPDPASAALFVVLGLYSAIVGALFAVFFYRVAQMLDDS